MLKIRRSRDRLIFNMGIPILVRRHLCIEMAPRIHWKTKRHHDNNFVAYLWHHRFLLWQTLVLLMMTKFTSWSLSVLSTPIIIIRYLWSIIGLPLFLRWHLLFWNSCQKVFLCFVQFWIRFLKPMNFQQVQPWVLTINLDDDNVSKMWHIIWYPSSNHYHSMQQLHLHVLMT